MFTILKSSFVLFALTLAASAAEENLSRQIDVTPGGKLVVDVDFGNVQIVSGSDDKVALEAHRSVDFHDEAKEKEFLAAAPINVNKEGNAVTVRARRRELSINSIFGHSRMEAVYKLHVPKRFDFDLHTGGGDIAAADISGNLKANTSGGKLEFANLEGTLTARTSGGSIEVENCQCPVQIKTSGGDISVRNGKGNLLAKTSGGRIEVRNLSGEADVETSGGNLVFEKIAGRLIGRTSGGNIHATFAGQILEEMKLTTSAGNIDLVVPETAALDIVADTSVGHVTSALPLATTDSRREHLRGKLNGGGKSVTLQTSAGNITIGSASAEIAGR